MAEKGVTAVHNPASNLKLGSGVMPLAALRDGGVNVALGTDGAASNNALDMMREMYLAAILHKGIDRDTVKTGSADAIKMATINGAKAQGRDDCGAIESGKKADIVLLDLDSIHNIPSYDLAYTLAYSANSSDVRLTMVDGKILYENGEFTTLDIERVKFEMKNTVAHYFD
jgi:5-methylthioadenosine/S-adenosylhomocysteine deaminase